MQTFPFPSATLGIPEHSASVARQGRLQVVHAAMSTGGNSKGRILIKNHPLERLDDAFWAKNLLMVESHVIVESLIWFRKFCRFIGHCMKVHNVGRPRHCGAGTFLACGESPRRWYPIHFCDKWTLPVARTMHWLSPLSFFLRGLPCCDETLFTGVELEAWGKTTSLSWTSWCPWVPWRHWHDTNLRTGTSFLEGSLRNALKVSFYSSSPKVHLPK